MECLYKILSKLSTRKPVIRQLNLNDNDLVRLSDFGFEVVRDGHLYCIKDELENIVNGSKLVEIDYHGDIKLNRKYTEDFQTFKAFKESYNYIKQDFVKGGNK